MTRVKKRPFAFDRCRHQFFTDYVSRSLPSPGGHLHMWEAPCALLLRGDNLQMCDVRVASDNHSERGMATRIGVKSGECV